MALDKNNVITLLKDIEVTDPISCVLDIIKSDEMSCFVTKDGRIYFDSSLEVSACYTLKTNLALKLQELGDDEAQALEAIGNTSNDWFFVERAVLDVLLQQATSASGFQDSESKLSDEFLTVIQKAYELKASDVHVFCSPKTGSKIVFVVDKNAQDYKTYTFEHLYSMVSAFYTDKIKRGQGDFNPKTPQDGSGNRISLKNGGIIDLRYSSLPRATFFEVGQRHSFLATFRISKGESSDLSLENAGYLPPQLVLMKKFAKSKRGGLMLAGVTNSGKSTILGMLVDSVPHNRVIIGVEEPVEFIYKHPNACQMNAIKGHPVMDMGTLSMRTLRNGPNLLVVGEVRDDISSGAYLTATVSGHLAMGTIHTPGVRMIPQRMSEFTDPKKFANTNVSALWGYQALMSSSCNDCKIPVSEYERLDEPTKDSPLFKDVMQYVNSNRSVVSNMHFRNPEGCKTCDPGGKKAKLDKGLRSLVLAAEWVKITDSDCKFIENADSIGWLRYLEKNNWKGVEYHVLRSVLEGRLCPLVAIEDFPDTFLSKEQKEVYMYDYPEIEKIFAGSNVKTLSTVIAG